MNSVDWCSSCTTRCRSRAISGAGHRFVACDSQTTKYDRPRHPILALECGQLFARRGFGWLPPAFVRWRAPGGKGRYAKRLADLRVAALSLRRAISSAKPRVQVNFAPWHNRASLASVFLPRLNLRLAVAASLPLAWPSIAQLQLPAWWNAHHVYPAGYDPFPLEQILQLALKALSLPVHPCELARPFSFQA